MISSKMNRTNGGNRSSRIFVGILLVALACLVVLYYHEHRSAQDAVTLSATLEQQTRTLEESTEKFVALKDACHDEREQLVKANEDQEAKIDTALQQAQDWQQRYELVMNDKTTMENELKTLKSGLQTLQERYNVIQNEVSALKSQLAARVQQCEKDKELAADEATKLEKAQCTVEKQQLTGVHQQLLQNKHDLQVKVDQCDKALKEFSEQLRRDSEVTAAHKLHAMRDYEHKSDDKSFPLPSLNHGNSLEDQLSKKLRERFGEDMKPDHPSLPSEHDDNLSSKDIMTLFSDKLHSKDIDSYFNDKQRDKTGEDVGNYFMPKKQYNPAELAMSHKDDSATSDSPSPGAHMMHIGISHDSTNETDNTMEQKDDVNKTTTDYDHNGVTNDPTGVTNDPTGVNSDHSSHVGEAGDYHEDKPDDHHDHDSDNDDDNDDDDNDDDDEKADDDQDDDEKADDDQAKPFDKLLLGGDDNANDNGNHDNAAENDQDLFKIPRLPDLTL